MRILFRGLAVLGVVAGICLAVAAPANARVFVGFGFPFPSYYPPPAYYAPPPVYYAPPPAYYAPPPSYYAPPPASYAPPVAAAPPAYPVSAQSCFVNGAAVCPMEHPTATGSTCWCSTDSGRVYGQAR